MNNLKINQELEDQYVDASVALIMDQYAQVLSQKLDQEMENDKECADLVYPEALDQRCQQLIQEEYTRMRRKKRLVTAKKILNRAAIIFVALLAIGGVLFTTVEAIRLPIMNLFIEMKEASWIISGIKQDDPIGETFTRTDHDFTNAYANRMPLEFSVMQLYVDTEVWFTCDFKNHLDQQVHLAIEPKETVTSVDTEGMDFSMEVMINKCPGILIAEDEICQLIWRQDEYLVSLCTIGIPYKDVISLAETISRPAQ